MKKGLCKKVLASILMAVMIFSFSGCGNKEAEKKDDVSASADAKKDNVTIGILQLVEHGALDATKEGFVDSLKEEGLVEGENLTIDFQNAQNDQSNLKTMSQKFVNDGVDMIFAIATPSALSVAVETKDIPIIGSAITDYVTAGLIDSNEKPGGNITGTSDLTPVKEQVSLIGKLFPKAKKVGVIYNSGEVNSQIQADMAKATCEEMGTECVFATVTSVNDIQQVVTNLVEEVDVIYVPTDNTVVSAMPLVTTITNGAKIPVICSEQSQINAGGLVSLAIDYYKLGFQTGKMAKKVLDGADIATMPIEYLQDTDLSINLDTAKALGFEFPKEYIDDADFVFENGELKTVEK